jgi:hypothetical protein
MRFSWKSFLGVIGALLVVAAASFVLLANIFWPHCDGEERVLATQSQGRSVVSHFEACTGIGTALTQSIELRSASGERTTILSYEPNPGIAGCRRKMFPTQQEPVVDWTNPRDIHISISVVAGIFEKHDAVNGIHITYDIGTVISRDCEPL